MQFAQARTVFQSSGSGSFSDIYLPDIVTVGPYDNSRAVKAYCAWLDQMGASYEVKYDYELGYLLVKSNVQGTPRREAPAPKKRRLGIRKRTT